MSARAKRGLILGPNGAGKSTLFNLITGDLKASAPSYVRCRRGIGRSYQIPKPFGGMTVFENVLAAASFASGKNAPACYDLCIDVLGRTGLLGKSNSVAGQLTLLERKQHQSGQFPEPNSEPLSEK